MSKFSNYREADRVERLGKLAATIATKTGGKLDEKQIIDIVSTLTPHIKYEIIVETEAKKAAEHLKLENYTETHSWAGDTQIRESGSVLLGNCEFGERYYYCYSNNGNVTSDEQSETPPDFNLSEILAVTIYRKDVVSWGQADDHDEDYNKLVIYVPEKEPYKMDDDLFKICKKYVMTEEIG